MLGVRLSPEMDKKLSHLSAKTHRPKSYYVKEALDLYLKMHEEDLLTIAEYEKQKREGTLVLYTLDEIKEKYDID